MSTHVIPYANEEIRRQLDSALLLFPRLPTSVETATGAMTLRFTPDLTVEEAAELTALMRAIGTTLTRQARDGIEDDLAAMRTFRQQSQSEFIALTQNQRDRALFDVVSAQTNVIRALLRDS